MKTKVVELAEKRRRCVESTHLTNLAALTLLILQDWFEERSIDSSFEGTEGSK